MSMRLSTRISFGGRRKHGRLKGFNYYSEWEGNFSGSWPGGSPDTIVEMASLGANCATITAFWYSTTGTSSDFHATSSSEPDSGVAIAVAQAHAAGMRTIIKPHINCLDGTWSGDIVPANTAQWFSDYKAHVLRYALIAQTNNCYALCIGNEFQDMTGPSYLSNWTDLISAVRAVYSGKLVYAADWYEVKSVAFWNLLDIIGVNFYIPLSVNVNPTLEEIIIGWNSVYTAESWIAEATNNQPPMMYYKSLSDQHGKPLMFTEIGYRNDDDAAKNPGLWGTDAARNDALQARLYEAYFRATRGLGDWFMGAQFWNWYVGVNTGTGDQLDNKGFSPQNRLAETVVETWFKNPPPPPSQSGMATLDSTTVTSDSATHTLDEAS